MVTRVWDQPLPQAPHKMDLCQSQSIRRTISLSSSRETVEPPGPASSVWVPPPPPGPPPLSLGPPSPSQSERRFRVCSKSESSCLENPKFPRDRVSLLMDNDVAEEEVTPVLENLDPP
ncbi:unnamed protein product [Gadus morhua 'NCC']